MDRPEALEPTPIVDLWVDLRHADPRDLVSLHRLGTRAVVGSFGAAARGELPTRSEERFERALAEALPRLEAAGLGGGLCLGIAQDQIPATGRERLLSRLPEYLGAPGVLGIGPIGLSAESATEGPDEGAQRRFFEAQLALAGTLRRPVLVALPRTGQAAVIAALVEATRAARVEASSVAVLHGEAQSIQILHSLGFCCVLDALSPETAAALASRLGAGALGLGSGVGAGPVDLLRGRRILARARESGLSPAACRALAGKSAARLFGLSLSQSD